MPAAAEELALRGGTCNLELGQTRTSLAPVDEASGILGGGAPDSVLMKLVLALDIGTLYRPQMQLRRPSADTGPLQRMENYTHAKGELLLAPWHSPAISFKKGTEFLHGVKPAGMCLIVNLSVFFGLLR